MTRPVRRSRTGGIVVHQAAEVEQAIRYDLIDRISRSTGVAPVAVLAVLYAVLKEVPTEV